MKVSKEFEEWLASHKLTIYQALSLAFVPRRSYKAVTEENERRLAVMQRLHTLTSLEEFKLTPTEATKLKGQWTEQNEIDKLISDFLIKKLKNETSGFKDFEVEDQLIYAHSRFQDKKVLTNFLTKKYLNSKNLNVKKVNPKSTKVPMKTGPSTLQSFLKEIQTLFKRGKDEEIKNFILLNREDLREALQYFNILMQTEPLKKYKEVFKNLK